jgi:hypothetical protein
MQPLLGVTIAIGYSTRRRRQLKITGCTEENKTMSDAKQAEPNPVKPLNPPPAKQPSKQPFKKIQK